MDDNFSIKRQNIRTLSLVIFTLMYLLTGAVIFDTLESDTEEKNRAILNDRLHKFKEKTNMSEPEFKKFVHHMIKRATRSRSKQWDFNGSLYFCTLVLALIGKCSGAEKEISIWSSKYSTLNFRLRS